MTNGFVENIADPSRVGGQAMSKCGIDGVRFARPKGPGYVFDRASDEPVAIIKWQCLVEVLLIVAVFFVATGDVPPHVNESHYLCRLKHFWNPAWCVGDLFLESADTQLVLIWLFGWVTRFVSLTATAWIGRVIAWTALAWAWQRLSWRIVPRRLAAVLSAALFIGLNYYLHMAGEWIVGGVEGKCFAYAFVLMALRELLDNRWNRVWLLLGAATAFHPLVGGWSGVVCVGVWLIAKLSVVRCPSTVVSRQLFVRPSRLTEMLPGLFGGGVIGLIGIVPALALTWNVPADVVAESNRIYVFDRLPHHLAPLALPAAEATRRLAGHAALLVALWVLSRASRRGNSNAMARIVQFAWGAALLACVGLTIELVLFNQPLIAAKLLRYYWFRMTDFAAAMAVAMQITALIAGGFERRRSWAAPALCVAVIFSGWYPLGACWARIAQPNTPSDAKIVDYPAWIEACEWVAANTPPNALFITPRLSQTFKWRTGRPEVANRKDIPQDAGGLVEWSRRIKDLYAIEFGGEEQLVDSVGALGTERVKELARKYHAQYVLADRGQLLGLPIAFWNEEYVVYRIQD